MYSLRNCLFLRLKTTRPGILNTLYAVSQLTISAIIFALGDIFYAAGDSVGQLFGKAISVLMRFTKSSTFECNVRAAALLAISKLFHVTGKNIEDGVLKDIVKAAKIATNDKSHLLQIRGLQVLQELVRANPAFITESEFDYLRGIIVKTGSTPSHHVHTAMAASFAQLLWCALQNEPQKHPQKKLQKRKTEMEDDPIAVRSQTPVKSQPHSLDFPSALHSISILYNKSFSSRSLQAGLISTYLALFSKLTKAQSSQQYSLIINHFVKDLLDPNKEGINGLVTRKHVGLLLRALRERYLSENAKVKALQLVSDTILNKWPEMGESESAPSPAALACFLIEGRALLGDLGFATAQDQQVLRDNVERLIHHPTYTVQNAAARFLKTLVSIFPSQIVPMFKKFNKDCEGIFSQPENKAVGKRAIGDIMGISVLLSVWETCALYCPEKMANDAQALAMRLFKLSAETDLKNSAMLVYLGWLLITSLTCADSEYLKTQISIILALWKNALPKPLPIDAQRDKNSIETAYLLYVRVCALLALEQFLFQHRNLVTRDVARKCSEMLSNSARFIANLKGQTQMSQKEILLGMTASEIEALCSQRTFKCQMHLANSPHYAFTPTETITQAVNVFCSPIALPLGPTMPETGSGDVWDAMDNYGHGISSFARHSIYRGRDALDESKGKHWLINSSLEQVIEHWSDSPIWCSEEYSPGWLNNNDAEDPPPMTGAVDAALLLFGIIFPFQNSKVQESTISALISTKRSVIDANKTKVFSYNITLALHTALSSLVKQHNEAQSIKNTSTQNILSDILISSLSSSEPGERLLAAQSIGRLCSLVDDKFVSLRVQLLNDAVVNNRRPDVRSGSALALSYIHNYIGGMAGAYHLKSNLGIVLSLCVDPHPQVHFWAIEAVGTIIEASDLTFSAHQISTLNIIGKLVFAETHDYEELVSSSSNISMEFEVYPALLRCIDSIISVMGPELQFSEKPKEIILPIVEAFMPDDSYMVSHVMVLCSQHIYLFAPALLNLAALVQMIRQLFNTKSPEGLITACDALYQLMHADASAVFKATGNVFVAQIWTLLDNSTGKTITALHEIIMTWLQQTATDQQRQWIHTCLQIVIKGTRTRMNNESTTDQEYVDEAAAFGTNQSSNEERDLEEANSASPWQSQAFAVRCLHTLLSINVATQSSNLADNGVLVENVGELVRIAFAAATGRVNEFRMIGLSFLRDIIKEFADWTDPDFPDAALLEQYQAQIGSALTPAFALESSPEVAAEAITICAEFMSSGIISDSDHISRFIKLLASSLESCVATSSTFVIGKLQAPSASAETMLRLSVLSAWAELEISSQAHPYLQKVVEAHIQELTPLWLACLRDYANLRFDPALESVNVSGARSRTMDLYESAWPKIVSAIASLVDQNNKTIFAALDGKSANTPDGIDYRVEPVAFFFVLYGLCFEAINFASVKPGNNEQLRDVLVSLKRIIRPSISGAAIYQDGVFTELTDALDRLVLLEGTAVQREVLEISESLVFNHSEALKPEKHVNGDHGLVIDIDQIFDLARIAALVLQESADWLSASRSVNCTNIFFICLSKINRGYQ